MKNTLKKLLSIVLAVSFIFLLSACEEPVKSETGIKSLSLEDLSDKEFYVGVKYGSYELSVICYNEYDENSINLVIEDDTIIDVTYKYTDTIWFTGYEFDINCLKPGTTSFYFETIDSIIKSDTFEITVKENVTSVSFDETDDITIYSWQDNESIEFDYESAHSITEIHNVFSFVSENPDVVNFRYDYDGSIFSDYGIITPVNPGETYIYIQTLDGSIKSQKIKVIVPGEEPEVEDNDVDENIEDNNYEEEPQENSVTVYITPTGKKYHYSSACAGKNAMERDLSDVEGSYGPCKKCAY